MKRKARYTLTASIIAGSAALFCAGMQVNTSKAMEPKRPTETISVNISCETVSNSVDDNFIIEPTETPSPAYTETTEGYSETVSIPKEPEPTETESVLTDRKYYNIPLSEDIQDHLFFICDQYNIDPSFVVAVIEHESNFRPKVIGDKGATQTVAT